MEHHSQSTTMSHEAETPVTTTAPSQTFRVAVVGLGYVGLPLAILAEERGHIVKGFDIDRVKIALLQKREAAFLSDDESRFFKRSKMELAADESVLKDVDVYVICVPTPVDQNHTPDLRPVIGACESVGRALKKGALVVLESTVNPGVCEEVGLSILERNSGLKAEKDFFFAHCPERINPGDTRWNTRSIPRVVGASGPVSLARALAFYRSIIDGSVTAMGSIKEAEAVKMVENAFRDVNIAFVNELAMSFGKAGIDIMNVLKGASTKPFAFMPHTPGCGVGGHCIPVDPYYLIRYGRENGFEHRFLMAARRINNEMPRYTVDLLAKTLEEKQNRRLHGSTIALLGLAYKRDVPDLRESPALEIREELERRGAKVRDFDPFLPDLSHAHSVDEALSGADAALIATDHSIFRTLTPSAFRTHGVRVVIDGRNCLPKEEFVASGLAYHGIGR